MNTFDLRQYYTEKIGRAFGRKLDFEVCWMMDDMGLTKTATEIKETLGSNRRITDQRTWAGKWRYQNYDYYRGLLEEKL